MAWAASATPTSLNGGFCFSGDIAEVIVYQPRAHRHGRQQVRGYLNARYFNAVQAPNCALTSPSNGNTFSPGSNITLTASASANGSATISNVKFYQGGTLLSTVSTSPYTYTWNSVAAGGYALTAVATDSNSLSTTSSAVNIAVGTAPTCSITARRNGTTYTAPASITITASASSSTSTIKQVDFYQGAIDLATVTTSPYSFTWTSVASGAYSLTVKATDNIGPGHHLQRDLRHRRQRADL